MRVGIDASNLRAGGGVTHLVELLRAATPAEQGIDEVVVWGGASTLQQLPNRPWLRRQHDAALDRALPWRVAWQTAQLPRLAARACDVLFTPGATTQRTPLPVVTMCQNMLPFEANERRRFGRTPMRARLHLLEYSQRRAFQQAAGVIFLTHYARQAVQAEIGALRGQQAIIPHGIAAEFRRPPRQAQPAALYSAERPFRLLYVSIVTVYKHQWAVAEAVAQLRAAGLPLVIDFAGPAYEPSLQQLQATLQRLDPQGAFTRYLGPIKYADLPQLYSQADAFVYASSCENLPIILLEAMASGLPIACSNRGPMPEVLQDAGIYFDPENPADIAQAVRALFTDQALRQQLARRAAERSQGYTWEHCAQATFAFIARVGQHAAARA